MTIDYDALMQEALNNLEEAVASKEKEGKKKERQRELSKKSRESLAEKYRLEKAKKAREERLKRKESAMFIAETFVAKAASDFLQMMQHGDKLDGMRIIFGCSKNDHSSDYHIYIENPPQTRRVIHKSQIEELATKNPPKKDLDETERVLSSYAEEAEISFDTDPYREDPSK